MKQQEKPTATKKLEDKSSTGSTTSWKPSPWNSKAIPAKIRAPIMCCKRCKKNK